MDFVASGTVSTPLAGQTSPHDLLATTPLIILAAIVWLLELGRRYGGLRAETWAKELRQAAPELLGLVGIASLAAFLLARGGNQGAPIRTAEDQEIWQSIQAEWQVLTTADSLLGAQAMLRLLLVGSAALRGASPLAFGCTAKFLLLAAAARVALLALSPRDIYHLDGPLGGNLNAALEVAALLPLAYLSRGASRRQAPVLLVSCLAAAGVAWTNHLALAEPGQAYLDALFSLEQLLEFLASAACLAGAAGAAAEGDGCQPLGAPAAFAHCLLPLQQLLPAYFMLTAWGAAPFQVVPELVGAGRPFEVLQSCGVAQVGFYLLAGVLRLAIADPEPKNGQLLEGQPYLEV